MPEANELNKDEIAREVQLAIGLVGVMQEYISCMPLSKGSMELAAQAEAIRTKLKEIESVLVP